MIAVFTDGACRGNPGPMGAGAAGFSAEPGDGVEAYPQKDNFNESDAVFVISEYLGHGTNNEAEYRAVILALEQCVAREIEKAVFYLDSQLVERQLKGVYKVKHPQMKKLFLKVKEYEKNIETEFIYIRRESNTVADMLANRAIDESKNQ